MLSRLYTVSQKRDPDIIDCNFNTKLSYRRETARQLPTWRGLGTPAHSPSAPSGYTYAYCRIRNPQEAYVKRAVH